MHPNEGFDLGLLRLEHPVQLCRGIGVEEYLKGGVGVCEMVDIALLNNCPKETLLVGKTLYRLLGEPSKAVVLFDGHRLFIHKA